MPAFQHIPLSIIEPITPQKLAQGGAFLGQVPAWDGVQYTPQNPVSWFNAGSALGKISEINILGSGVFSSVVGNRATLTINAGAITVNGQPVTAINPGANMSASVVGGVATLNAVGGGSITMQNGGGNAGLVMNPGTGSVFTVKGLSAGAGIQLSDFGTQVLITALGGGYTHPNYQSFSYEPFVSGGFISIPAVYTDGIGSVTQVINRTFPFSTGGGAATPVAIDWQNSQQIDPVRRINFSSAFSVNMVGTTANIGLVGGASTGVTAFNATIGAIQLIGGTNTSIANLGSGVFQINSTASGGGGITGIALNGLGSYTNIQFGSGFSVSGNFVNAIGGGHTIGNGALGAGIVSLPGFAASHTLKGLVGGGATTVTDMGSHILISSTGGGAASNTIEARFNDITINPAAYILNFKGPGVTSVTNGVGVEITIGGGSVAGVSSFNGATGAIQVIGGTNTSITNLGGGIYQFNATAGSASLAGFTANGLTVTSNTVSLAMASLANAGAMPAWSGNATDFLNGLGQWVTPSGVGITGISVNGLGSYTNLQFGAGLAVVGNTITATGVTGGITNVVSSTPTVLSASVSAGTATIGTIGFSGTFTPSFNVATKTLSLPNHSLASGVTSSIGTTFVDLSSLSAPTLPSGTNGDVFVHNGTSWAASSSLKIFPFSLQSTSWISFNPGGGGPNTNLFSIDAIFSRLQAQTLRLNDMTGSQTIIGRDINNNARGIITVISDGLQRLAFFNTAPTVQPVLILGDHASTQAALIALGLARF